MAGRRTGGHHTHCGAQQDRHNRQERKESACTRTESYSEVEAAALSESEENTPIVAAQPVRAETIRPTTCPFRCAVSLRTPLPTPMKHFVLCVMWRQEHEQGALMRCALGRDMKRDLMC